MAANIGSGVDWIAVQKSLVSASQGSHSTFRSSDVPLLLDTILESKRDILDHHDKYENFYSCFVALSAHYITDHSSLLSKSMVGNVGTVCHILMDFCLQRMLKYKEACSVSQRNLMSLIEGLCTGTGQLQRSSIVTLTAMLKTAQMPPSNKPETPPEDEKEKTLVKVSESKAVSQATFLRQLMSAFSDSSPRYAASAAKAQAEKESQKIADKDAAASSKIDPALDMKTHFAARNVDNLHSLHGADILLDVCLNLPFLQRYINNYRDAAAGFPFTLPSTVAEATSMKASFPSLLNDMTIVSRVLALPTLEPMTPTHLEKLSTIVMSCLYASVAAATTNSLLSITSGQQIRGVLGSTSKDEDQENIASLIVQKGLGLFKTLSGAIQMSTRAGGHNLQNLHMLGAWCILHGLEHILKLHTTIAAPTTPPPALKTSESATASRPSSAKPLSAVQGIGSLVVALASYALSLLKVLLEDLHIEGLSLAVKKQEVSLANVSILPTNSAWQRVCRIVNSLPLTDLMINLFTIGYKKACVTVRQRKESVHSEGGDTDSNSLNECYDNDFGSSEETSEDEDSEPILGPWFEETLSPSEPETKETTSSANLGPPPPPPVSTKKEETKKDTPIKRDSPNINELSDKDEPGQYLKLATDVLQFVTVHMLNSTNGLVKSFIGSNLAKSLTFTDAHIAGLANVIKDLDKGSVKMDDSTLMENFSTMLLQFSHTLVAADVVDMDLQNVLLNHLGVLPSAVGPWPLNIPPRSLAVLAHILLRQQQRSGGAARRRQAWEEEEEGTHKDIITCMQVWERFLGTLTDRAVKGEPITEAEDVNVEHLQLLLFIFESLPRDNRKNILVRCAEALIMASRASCMQDKSPLAVCRLLLVLEFFVRHFSQPRPFLYEQVQWNIFTVQSSDPALMLYQEEKGGIAITKFYNPCREVEENYRKATTGETATAETDGIEFKRCFYNLVSSEVDCSQDVPVLDKEACDILFDANFDYNDLYQAVVELLGAGSLCDVAARKDDKILDYMDSCAVHYTRVICWRLLGCLPPSVAYMKLLEGQHTETERALTQSEVLHTLRWVPRMGSDKFKPWIKEQLCEQRLPDTEADSLLDIVVKNCNNIKYDIALAQEFIVTQLSEMPLSVTAGEVLPVSMLPSLHSISLLDAVIGKLNVSLDDGFTKAMNDTSPKKSMDVAKDLIPIIFQLIEIYTAYSRSCLLHQVAKNPDLKSCHTGNEALSAFGTVMRIGSGHASKLSAFGLMLMVGLPIAVKTTVEKWNKASISEFPAINAWRTAFANDIIPSESYLNAIQSAHISSLSNNRSLAKLSQSKAMSAYERKRAEQLEIVRSLVAWPSEVTDATLQVLADEDFNSVQALMCISEVDIQDLAIPQGQRTLLRNVVSDLKAGKSKSKPASSSADKTAEPQIDLRPMSRMGIPSAWTDNGTGSGITGGNSGSAAAKGIEFTFGKLLPNVGIFKTDTGQTVATITSSMKHVMLALVRFCSDLLVWCYDAEEHKDRLVEVMFPLLLDASTEGLADLASVAVERVLGASDGDDYTTQLYFHVISACHELFTKYSNPDSGLDEMILQESIRTMENHLDKEPAKKAMEKFYTEKAELITVLLSAANENLSAEYGTKVLKFFNRLLQLAEENPEDKSLETLCMSMGKLASIDLATLQKWLSRIIRDSDPGAKGQENRLLLQNLTSYIVKENSLVGENVAMALLKALIPMGSELLAGTGDNLGFSELMPVMITLAGAGSGLGHVELFNASNDWLAECKKYLSHKDVAEKLSSENTEGKHRSMMEAACYLLSYIANVLGALKQTSDKTLPTVYDVEAITQDVDSDWAEDMVVEEEDSGGEDSDEDSLCNKLCTFTITQKEFMNQHWYHCHTCKMVDGVGVCTICAKVCHRGHELSYAKYGSFFCDCGAKEDGSCQALTKRTPGSNLDSSMAGNTMASPFSSTSVSGEKSRDPSTGSLRHRTMVSPTDKQPVASELSSKLAAEEINKFRQALAKQLEKSKDIVLTQLENCNTASCVVELLQSLMDPIEKHSLQTSAVGATSRAQKALQELHANDKNTESTDQLMVPTLGSQEGAFENVRANFSGDQGQQIRQLLGAHMLRRVAMCCLASPHGRRQHLAVCHEKGRITVLQLSQLLKQADSSKRKLTLTRLSSAPVPFSVLSITGNPCNEDFLAVCGLKDCHVLTFTSSGTVSDHLVLHPQLEAGNFIIKAIWLPGSQTELAIVTADFVKVYDLSKDALSPCFYFLVPSGKIRDACFIFTEESRTLILMSSAGYLYTQPMEEASEAKHGPFYVTNVLDVKHDDLTDSGGQIAGGGVSCYYSHTLQLLFFSYAQGKSFCAPVGPSFTEITQLFPITLKPANGSGKGNNNPPALCQWNEVLTHPGLVCCLTQTTSIPVILMIEPDKIRVQEIKTLPAKAKVQDMVAIRHTSSSDQHRTTLILLCEDGSLRIYMASVDHTGFWMSGQFQATGAISALKPARKKKATKAGRPSGQVSFPVDFFEHCQAMNDVEIGGNDLLQIYNVQQIKHRLNTTGMYVASTKPGGFSIEIINNNNSMVMVGVRVHVGAQSIERVPSYLEINGRTVQVSLTHNRWFDMPFTREESLTADKKITLFVGPSVDPAGVTMVDSIKVYSKTKEAFGWPDDPPDDFPSATGATLPPSTSASPANESESIVSPPVPLTSLDKLVASSLEVLEGFVSMVPMEDKESIKATIQDLATELLTLPTPTHVQQHTKAVLATTQPTSTAYHNHKVRAWCDVEQQAKAVLATTLPTSTAYFNHKDQAQLGRVVQCLPSTPSKAQEVGSCPPELDPEAYQRLVVTARSVAVARPTNLVRFADAHETTLMAEDTTLDVSVDLESEEATPTADANPPQPLLPAKMSDLDTQESKHFLARMVDAFWRLHNARPSNTMLAPACLPGLTHIEITVGALIEVIHAFASTDLDNVGLATKLYVQLLNCEDQGVSFAAKQALIKVMRPHHKRRKVVIPSPPRCSSPSGPGVGDDDNDDDEGGDGGDKSPPGGDGPGGQEPVSESSQDEASYEVVEHADLNALSSQEQAEPMVLIPGEGGGPGAAGNNQLPLEALLGGRSGFAPMLDIPPDADDEAMMELAIALSLQEQNTQSGSGLNLQGLGLSGQGQSSSSLEAGTLSDTTASAAASDDEGSTAATDGSTLRTSPAEHGGSAGSESGGSAVDSITGEHSASGRSSAYGDVIPETTTTRPESVTSSGGMPSTSMGHPDAVEMDEGEMTDVDTGKRMHTLRLMLLEKLLQYMPELRDVGGVRAIPFMQVVLMLSSDLDVEDEKDKAAMDHLLSVMLGELNMSCKEFSDVASRTAFHEVQLIIMRLLSVFMSRTKSGTKTASESSTLISHATAAALLNCGAVDYCLLILKSLLDHWKETDLDEDGATTGGNLLKSHSSNTPPDMSPFFLRQYVKGHAGDVFEAFPQLLTEMVLRLPYQIKKICDSAPSVGVAVFDQAWFYYLCEYMMTQQTPFVRRQVRKLLLFICGTKDKYRQLRDLHTLESHMRDVKSVCTENGLNLEESGGVPISLPYDTLITLIEHLKACQEIATSRTLNWQKFCHKDETVLLCVLHASFYLGEGVSPLLLQLLTCALCGAKSAPRGRSSSSGHSKHKRDREKAEKKEEKEKSEGKESSEEAQRHDDAMCQSLINQINRLTGAEVLSRFIRQHLLESNSSAVRWQAHGLLLHLFKSSPAQQQDQLVSLMWDLWAELSNYGRNAAQFVDLLGYVALKAPYSMQKSLQYVQKAAALLKSQNLALANHANSTIYNMLFGLVEFDGYFLESDPCLVCNNPEVPFSSLKLTALKVDSRYTANTQIVKLVGTHTIAKVTLRISDLKRTKMVRTVNFYYNNRTVQSVVELKNKPTMWHKAKKCQLAAGQTELKVEFPLPIVATNLMIEYSDFYDNLTASAETLQCPRCSASVPANPGVCGNCGENVFQCHKCRAINYDEKDPFLCNACGFCKYAKFDYTLTARACCAVDPIETEDDRKKATTTINSLLEKADNAYRQLLFHKHILEALLVKAHESGRDRPPSDSVQGSGSGGGGAASVVNKTIQQIAQRYCNECRGTFDDLSKFIQKVLASRKELVEYDRRQQETAMKASAPSTGMTPIATPLTSPHPSPSPSSAAMAIPSCQLAERNRGRCYGCAAAATEHCVTLLRALATNAETRQILVKQGLIQELVEYNLRRGTAVFRSEVRQLLALLTRDNSEATQLLNDILMSRITAALKGHRSNPDLASAVRNEMALLVHTMEKDDSCWENRLRCVMKLFLLSVKTSSPVVMENITLPCLRILQHLVKPQQPTSKKHKDKNVENLSTVKPVGCDVYVNTARWLNTPNVGYGLWKQRVPVNEPAAPVALGEGSPEKKTTEDVRGKYLMEKYARKWKAGVKKSPDSLRLGGSTWLRRVLFSASSRQARQVACNIVESLCQVSSRRQQMLDLLTSYLDEVGPSGESASEFLALYQRLTKPPHWKLYLAAKGVLPHIGTLLTKEIEILSALEETTLSSDLSQGYAPKMLTELLSSFLEVEAIRRHYKSKLLGPVLHGYLALRKLVVQRTKLVDETQQMLLELLEDMTTGTELETRAFMAVCVDTVKRYGLDDLRTPVFIFERLCSVIYPEENDIGEFFMTLEKDPQQEDFLQGRMQGNPYSSNEPDLGPLMRDVKNKICRDCELIALLDDDTGMELLVNNKIISLELPVKDVYKKIWCPDNEGQPMRIVYRLRGLMGDATEDIIENLDNQNEEETDDEEVYKMATVMSECEGLEVMLHRLAGLTDLVRGQQLLAVLLKLLDFTMKVKVNRQRMIEPSMQALNIMLAVLNRVLLAENEDPGSGGGAPVAERLLGVMEVVLMEANTEPLEHGKPSVILSCDKSQLVALLDRINSPFVRAHTSVLQGLMRIIPFLSFGDVEKMKTLIDHFRPYMDFNKFDGDHSQDEDVHLECFCAIAAGIESNANGDRLKNLMIDEGIPQKAVGYVIQKLPQASSLESPPWKEFLALPALPYVLRILTGLCKGHATTQVLVGTECVPAVHRMEQISSEEGIGSLSENLMEALKSNPDVAKKIDEVRTQTKAEKKKLAMAMRMKQLGALGMSTNEKGQVKAKSSVLQQMEDLVDESGLTCCICREGYKYQPLKVLGIYTYTKCAPMEEFDTKARKTQGFSTVSHFNIVHYDCHVAAVRHARGREEWESAVLQNANTKCNGLLPLWGPQVPESQFASCLARHNIYLQECTGHREPNYHTTIHDLKLLLSRFASEKSFSDDSGGGGRQSNIHLVPYMVHIALYVINTTRSASREEKNVQTFLTLPTSKWPENSYEVDGAFYTTLLHLHILPPDKWKENKVQVLKQLIATAHIRNVSPSGCTSVSDKTVKDYSVYKPACIYLALVDYLYTSMFKGVPQGSGSWPSAVASFIRNNDEVLLKSGDKMLSTYEGDYLPCESFAEFCDIAGLLGDITKPDQFIADIIKSLP